ncbi:MAG: nucleotidyltransferase [Clostridia bacterium]|nr:nucleotidyltransferase [Clostridia bacterium]
MKAPILVIMAAGLGSRYGGLKQMDAIGPNESRLIDYSVYDAYQAGFKKVIFIVNAMIKEDFIKLIGNRISKEIHIETVVQDISDIPFEVPKHRVKPWGTAHAVYAARDKIDAPFVVINADDYYGREAFKQMYQFLTQDVNECTYGMVAFNLYQTMTKHGSVSRGVCQVENHQLISVKEKIEIYFEENQIISKEGDLKEHLPSDQLVSMNMWGFHPNVLQRISNQLDIFRFEMKDPLKSEFFLPDVVSKAIEEHTIIKVLESKEKWYGVTYKEDKAEIVDAITKKIKAGEYPEALWRTHDSTIYIGENL